MVNQWIHNFCLSWEKFKKLFEPGLLLEYTLRKNYIEDIKKETEN